MAAIWGHDLAGKESILPHTSGVEDRLVHPTRPIKVNCRAIYTLNHDLQLSKLV
jgi:hypothetical protein